MNIKLLYSKSTLILFICSVFLTINAGTPKSQQVKCAVCRSLVTEINKAIKLVDPRKTIEVGSYRIEANGEQKKASRKYAGSEVHMTELLDSVCEVFKDYVQAHHKETKRFEAIKLVEDGKMNPRFSEYELVQDPDLNKGVQYHCQSIVEDYEDEIVEHFSNNLDLQDEESQEEFCESITHICSDFKDEL